MKSNFVQSFFKLIISLIFINVFYIDDVNAAADKKSKDNYRENTSFHNDFAPDFPDSIIPKRISTVTPSIPITFNDKVRRFIDYFTIDNRDYVRMVLRRQQAYFPIFEEALKRHNMPDDLKYLVIVESGINPKALSPATALGLWQFMPSTGKMYNLNYDYYVDERMDPYKATEAACKFLKQLYAMFNDWELALAAYNCGPGNVRKAIRRSGYKKNFWQCYAYLPRETRGYVPQFMAFSYIMRFHDLHNIHIEDPYFFPNTDTITVNQYYNIEVFANAVNICSEELLTLNPEIKRNVIPTTKTNYPLILPDHIYNQYKTKKDSIDKLCLTKGKENLNYKGKEPSWSKAGKMRIVYRVRSGDVLGKIAQRHGVRTSDLRRWNRIGSNNVIRVGQKLYIYKDIKGGTSYKSSTPSAVPSSGYHIVKSGETLWSISRKYEGLTIDKLKSLNNLSSSSLAVGQKLRLK